MGLELGLTLKGNHTNRLGVFEKMVPRRVIEPMREEIPVGWRKVHNEKINNLCSWWNNTRFIKWGGWDIQDMQHT